MRACAAAGLAVKLAPVATAAPARLVVLRNVLRSCGIRLPPRCGDRFGADASAGNLSHFWRARHALAADQPCGGLPRTGGEQAPTDLTGCAHPVVTDDNIRDDGPHDE